MYRVVTIVNKTIAHLRVVKIVDHHYLMKGSRHKKKTVVTTHGDHFTKIIYNYYKYLKNYLHVLNCYVVYVELT